MKLIEFKTKPWLRLIGLLLFFFLAYTWSVPFRDIYGLEIRNALMAREMLENGLTIIPKVLGCYYPDYLPFYFWLATIFSMPVGTVSTLSAVFPSALAAVGLLALTYYLASRINRRTGWLSALILATIPSFWLNAGSASIDMLLAFFVTAAIICFYCKDEDNNPRRKNVYILTGGVALLAAFMVKGPIGIVLPAVTWGGYLLLNKRFKDLVLFSFFILVVGLLCVGLELSLAYEAGGKGLVDDIIRMQVTGRLTVANKPFYYYFISLLEIGSLWWLLIIVCSYVLVRAGKAKQEVCEFANQQLGNSVNRLVFSWVLGIFTVFSLAATKHARYLLPLYPALSIILAVWVQHFLIDKSPLRNKRIQYISVFFSIALLSAGIVSYAMFHRLRFVPLELMIIWITTGTAGIALLTRWIKPSHRLVGSILLLLSVGLSGVNLIVIPTLARRASAHAFVAATESLVAPLLPVVIYGLGRDRDALKYIFYSNRNPTKIRFVNSLEELQSLPESCLLITPFADKILLLTDREIHKLTEGNIRSKKLYAYHLEEKQHPDL